jgi:hypothetical protein
METDQLLELVKQLDQQGRVRLYMAVALELTVGAREAYFYPPEKAKETLRGLNELIHSLLGHALAVSSNSARTPDEEVAARMFGFAEKLGVRPNLSLALDAVPSGVIFSTPSS